MALWWLLNYMYSFQTMLFSLRLVLSVCFCAHISRRMALFVMIMRRISFRVVLNFFPYNSSSTCVASTGISSSVIMTVMLTMFCYIMFWGLALIKVVPFLQAYVVILAATVHLLEYVFKAQFCRFRSSNSNKTLITNHVCISACLPGVVWYLDKCGLSQIVYIRLSEEQNGCSLSIWWNYKCWCSKLTLNSAFQIFQDFCSLTGRGHSSGHTHALHPQTYGVGGCGNHRVGEELHGWLMPATMQQRHGSPDGKQYDLSIAAVGVTQLNDLIHQMPNHQVFQEAITGQLYLSSK